MAGGRITDRQRRGAWAEQLVADHLSALGWTVLGRNLRIGRDEIDLLALEPTPTPVLVVVEVRGVHARSFGAPEERVDRAKVRRLYRAAGALRQAGALEGLPLPAVGWRVDLLTVDAREPEIRIGHLRALEPP